MPLKGFHLRVQTCILVDINQPLPWFFMRWPRADSFTVSRALGRTYLRLSCFCNILPQDLAQSHVKITRSTNLLSVCRRKLKLLTYALFKLQQHKLSQSSGFYSITWRMISRSAGYKIHFLKQPLFRGNFVPCRCDIFRFFAFILDPLQFGIQGSRVLIQSNI